MTMLLNQIIGLPYPMKGLTRCRAVTSVTVATDTLVPRFYLILACKLHSTPCQGLEIFAAKEIKLDASSKISS